jgi:hypothetical protein
MRRAILAGAILVSAIGVAPGTGITAASAQNASPSLARAHAAFPINICLPPKTQCMNDWNGNLDLGAEPVRFFHYGNSGGNNAIVAQLIGTINTNGGFEPFTNGSNLNARYNSRPVYEFEWYRNGGGTGICIAGDSYNANPFNEECNSGSGSLFYAYSSYSFLISVGGSNVLYANTHVANQPVWMGSNGKGNISNGDPVYLTTTQANGLPWGFSSDGG